MQENAKTVQTYNRSSDWDDLCVKCFKTLYLTAVYLTRGNVSWIAQVGRCVALFHDYKCKCMWQVLSSVSVFCSSYTSGSQISTQGPPNSPDFCTICCKSSGSLRTGLGITASDNNEKKLAWEVLSVRLSRASQKYQICVIRRLHDIILSSVDWKALTCIYGRAIRCISALSRCLWLWAGSYSSSPHCGL